MLDLQSDGQRCGVRGSVHLLWKTGATQICFALYSGLHPVWFGLAAKSWWCVCVYVWIECGNTTRQQWTICIYGHRKHWAHKHIHQPKHYYQTMDFRWKIYCFCTFTDYNEDRLIYDEERKYGKIPAKIYLLYLKSCGLWTIGVFCLSALAWQATKIYLDVWLRDWTDIEQTNRFTDVRTDSHTIYYFPPRARFIFSCSFGWWQSMKYIQWKYLFV